MTLERDAIVDRWRLVSRLGRGGNGEVWRTVHPEYGEAALKILLRRSGDRWQRFRDEVEVMRRMGDRPGVLPLLASALPVQGAAKPAWLATPVADAVIDALGPDPPLTAVVDAVVSYATTLATLASEGVFHRDLKPANLFRREEQWAIGDFGLVAYPDKVAITVGNRRLGPLYFIAPEMLREPDAADPGPADVYSLAKTLWALATGQRYPPDGQVRVEVPSHDLANWVGGTGALALGLVIQSATDDEPSERLNMAGLANRLHEWANGDPTRDDRAAEAILRGYISSIDERLSNSVDPNAFRLIETSVHDMIPDARRRSEEKRRQLLREAMQQGEQSRRSFIGTYGIKGALDLHDSAWIGSLRDGDDFVTAVISRDPDHRHAELFRARQILWGRPLWWMHSVALIGSLRLRGQEGCEPLASELAAQEIRDHLLEFAEDPRLAAVSRLQRSLVPATARIVGYGPLAELSRSMRDRLSAEDRVRYSLGLSSGHVMTRLVDNIVRTSLRELNWTVEALETAAAEAESALERIPIPPVAWDGPLGDPWLQSWAQYSPLLMCGLTIIGSDPSADDLLQAPELREAIDKAAHSDFEMLQRPAVPLAARLQTDGDG